MKYSEITISNIKAYIKYLWQKVFGVYIPQKHLLAYAEMVVYRANRCPECVEAGKCLGCGCAMPEMAFDVKKSCGSKQAPKWPAVDDPNLTQWWADFKKRENFDLFIKNFS